MNGVFVLDGEVLEKLCLLKHPTFDRTASLNVMSESILGTKQFSLHMTIWY